MRWLVLALLLATSAEAHRARPLAPDDGVRIASLTHGQMAVIARYRGEILALADRRYPPDDTLRRLVNYARLQRAYCLWGLMPGTISDENSPFNSCAHAYLAATRAVLLRLDPTPQATALRQRIDDEMLLNGASLVLCAYSAEEFSTAVMVRPDWRWHWPSVAVFAMLALFAGGVMRALRT
ncbi:hypothetical protein [Paenirhodobacter sp.]|uniref:hypothetical protein n=1 Tax=Paenirhodobacter sp. TaxID=1965326 RepID=UPI003B3CBEBF